MKKLEDRVAIVTGAARGIGRACAEALAREGARVVLADVSEDEGEAAARDLAKGGADARFLRCDVGSRADVEALARAAEEAWGRIDVLINNAAIVHKAPFLELGEEDFERVLRVNLKGPFLVAQRVARQMVAAGTGGSIVNLSSVNAVMAIPDQVPYAVSKGGLNQLTKVMALALAPHAIRVNGIGPGSIATEMLERVMTDDEVRRTILSRTPLGRLGEPDEVARIAVFLASDDAAYLTGQTLYPDGGRLALNYTVPVAE
jgi:glucose 1-dehydrogenase